MQGNIEKTAKNIENYRKKLIFYNSARQGFSEILNALKSKYEKYTLLLPAYIGYSPNEGSGIYDPVIENKIDHFFYPIDEKINIKVEEFKRCIEKVENQLVVLIVHYFGYVDPNMDKLIEIARQRDAIIIEDCAHALYTDYIDNMCGSFSDISIYSLHKMLPYQNGGMVRMNTKKLKLESTNINYNIMEYELSKIAKKRKENAKRIEKELKEVRGITILRPTEQYKSQTPQTYPIIIDNVDRNDMYHTLNNEGYGAVSLYHTMIEPLKKEEFKITQEVSKKILNLPVHQDAEIDKIIKMCNRIKEIIGEKE